MTKSKSNFTQIIEYYASRKVGEVVFRADLKSNIDSYSYSSIDNTRRKLQIGEYICTDYEIGSYRILKQIPVDLTSAQLNWLAYPHRYKITKEQLRPEWKSIYLKRNFGL